MRARVGENISTNAPPFRSPQFDSLLNPTIFSQAKNNNDEAAMERSFALTLFQAVYLALPQKIAVSALATTFILIASSNMYDLENCAHESTTEAYTTNPKNESEEEPTKAAFRHEVFDEPVIITKKVRMPMLTHLPLSYVTNAPLFPTLPERKHDPLPRPSYRLLNCGQDSPERLHIFPHQAPSGVRAP